MDYETLRNKIERGEYESKLPYPEYIAKPNAYEARQSRDMKQAYREDSNKLETVFRADLRKYIENEIGKNLTDEQFSAIFLKAWEEGHSSGYNEVLTCANNLIDVLKPFLAKGNK